VAAWNKESMKQTRIPRERGLIAFSQRVVWPLGALVLTLLLLRLSPLPLKHVFIVLFTSVLLAAAVAPPARFLARYRVPRPVTILLIYLVAVAVLATSPLLVYAVEHPDQFNGRLGEVSVFGEVRDRGSLAPIVANAKRHLLMFNWEGDHNGRHNLPGEPELNVMLAGLFVLGCATALARVREPEYRLLVVWAALMLLPGILSVSFEAPQTSPTMDENNPAVLFTSLAPAFIVRAAGAARRVPGCSVAGCLGS